MSLTHQPCPDCGSSDALQINDDGSTKCYSCGKFTPSNKKESEKPSNYMKGKVKDIPARSLNRETCRKYAYTVSEIDGREVHIATHKSKEGKALWQKVRYVDTKEFYINKLTGKVDLVLYGMNLWNGYNKKVVVTEGEIDCLSVAQVFQNKYPVVSVPNGANGAAKAIKHNLEWLEQFEEVVFLFDMDEPGREAAKECAALLKVGKAKIAELPLKDPNEMLLAGKADELLTAIYRAKEYRPDGILSGDDILDRILKYDVEGFPYPFSTLNEKLQGIRTPSLVLIGAGTGVGKSLFMREIAYHFMEQGEKIGYIALEESVARTGINFIGFATNKLLHINPDLLTEEEKREAFNRHFKDKLYLYEHFGSLDPDVLINQIRYMRVKLGCKYIFLDHLSIVISGSAGADERKDIDRLVTALRSLVEETNTAIITAAHLKQNDGGKSHEEGGRVTLRSFRGSGAMAQLSDDVIGLERNQQSSTKADRTIPRVLKNRLIGDLGKCSKELVYNRETGRLTEEDSVPESFDEFIEEGDEI